MVSQTERDMQNLDLRMESAWFLAKTKNIDLDRYSFHFQLTPPNMAAKQLISFLNLMWPRHSLVHSTWYMPFGEPMPSLATTVPSVSISTGTYYWEKSYQTTYIPCTVMSIIMLILWLKNLQESCCMMPLLTTYLKELMNLLSKCNSML